MCRVAILDDDGLDPGPGAEIERARAELAAAQVGEAGGLGVAGGYVVDPERAQGCVDELSRIVEDVKFALRDARQMSFDPPGFDQVSVNVARNGALMAARAEAYVTAWANQIEAARDALQRQLNAYSDVDEVAAGRRS